VLLSRGRGIGKQPGEFRKSQNWIGGTRPGNASFVPPPHTAVPEAMSDLERFLHADEDGLPLLVRAGIAHLQFESIHPFLDGNGRVGRLLITLLLCAEGMLREPFLYLSLYLKKHRRMYYELLDGARRDGDWEKWLSFFLEGVEKTTNGAVSSAHALATRCTARSRGRRSYRRSCRRRSDQRGRPCRLTRTATPESDSAPPPSLPGSTRRTRRPRRRS